MKKIFSLAVSLITIMALAACSPAPTPGLNIIDMQSTAVADALTLFAMTQAAIPTGTPVPPMPTSVPPTPITEPATLVTLPTIAVETPVIAPAANNSNASPTPDCYQPAPLAKDLKGTTVQIKLVNKSDGPVDLSMGMYEPNEQGECYTFGFGISKKGSDVVTVLSGCYWIGGYQNGPKPSTPRVDYICLTDTTKTRGLSINNNSIGFD